MIEIQLLEQLAAFASCGTLSAAAKQLHISQPALSRAMRRLEEELGVQLFERRKSGLFLNDTGMLAVKYAQTLLLQETSMIRELREFDRKKHTIRTGFCTPVLVPDFTALLSKIFEGMTISTEIADDPLLTERLMRSRYQLAVLHSRPDENVFYAVPIEDEHLFVILPLSHPLAGARGLYLKDLDGETFLLYSQIGFWDALCRRKMPSSRFLVQQEMDVLGELVTHSPFPAFTTDYVFKQPSSIPSDRIAIPILDTEANVTYYCTCRQTEKAKFLPVFRCFSKKGKK